MTGFVLPVLDDLFEPVWVALSEHPKSPPEYWTELFSEMSRYFLRDVKLRLSGLKEEELLDRTFDEKDWLSSKGYVEPANDADLARDAIAKADLSYFSSEAMVLSFLEGFYEICQDLGGIQFAEHYYTLVQSFIHRHNLRYQLSPPFLIHPTLAGILTNLIAVLRSATASDKHLRKLLREYEEAVSELRSGCTESRIKTCLHRQYMLIEGVAYREDPSRGRTLGDQLNNVDWPHITLKEVGAKLYGFRNDYPGMGHGTSDSGAKRDLDLRELIGLSSMLIGLAPYATSGLDLQQIYGPTGRPRPGELEGIKRS